MTTAGAVFSILGITAFVLGLFGAIAYGAMKDFLYATVFTLIMLPGSCTLFLISAQYEKTAKNTEGFERCLAEGKQEYICDALFSPRRF